MVWGVIRIGIFTASFLVGLTLSGSGGGLENSKNDRIQPVHEKLEIPCSQKKLLVFRGERLSEKVQGSESFF